MIDPKVHELLKFIRSRVVAHNDQALTCSRRQAEYAITRRDEASVIARELRTIFGISLREELAARGRG